MVNGHVDAHGVDGGSVVVGSRQGVGVIAGEVRREGGGVAAQHLEEVGRVAHRGVVKRPIHHDGPLVALGVNRKHVGIEGVVSGQFEMSPRRDDIVHLDAKGLNFTLGHVDGDLCQRGFIPSFQDLGSGLHRVPNGGCTGCELAVRGLGPVVGGQHHGQAVAAHVNPGGVDVHAIIGGDGRG